MILFIYLFIYLHNNAVIRDLQLVDGVKVLV